MPIEDQPKGSEEPTKTEDKFSLKVGDREYKSSDDVINKITHQDEHIKTIEEENRQLHASLEAKKQEQDNEVISKIDNVLDQLDNVKAGSNQDPVSTEELVRKAVDERVRTALSEVEQTKVENANDAECMAAAREAYGEEKYQTTLAEKAAELGMTVERANTLAKLSPEAWKRLFVPNVSPTATPSQSSFNAPVVKPDEQGGPPKTDKPWSKMTQSERMAYTRQFMNQGQS